MIGKVFYGKDGIKVTVLAYSISPQGVPLITYEIEYPRLILAELNTHRQLSRNSFSSRAVPFLKMLQQLTGRPVRFGANQGGMQDKGEDYSEPIRYEVDGRVWKYKPVTAWELAKKDAIKHAKAFCDAGYHKQVYNRLLEPFQMMKTVLSATELSNFWWLRDDLAADPTLAELARVMREAMEETTPELLQPGEWHLPYIYGKAVAEDGTIIGYQMNEEIGEEGRLLTLEEAIKVSCARCAAVSYRNEGYGLEKSIEVYDRLVGSDKKHASAFEHCATPMRTHGFYPHSNPEYSRKVQYNNLWVPMTWEEGITHVDRKGQLWSGNFKGWIQFRKTIPGECYEN